MSDKYHQGFTVYLGKPPEIEGYDTLDLSNQIAMMIIVDFDGGIQIMGKKAVHALTFPECAHADEKLLNMQGLVKALRFWADKLEIPDLSAKIGVEYKGE